MTEAASPARPLHPLVLAFAAALVLVGVLSRVVPLLDIGGRLLAQWPTEDGYFMLAIARNFALGHGFSVTGGEMPTNGTQPGTTFLWSIIFFIVGGEKKTGVALVQVIEVLVAIAAAVGLYRLTLRVLIGQPQRREIAIITAAVWFASPLVVPHSMNCLETGVYACIGIWISALFIERPLDDALPWSIAKSLAVGVLLGAAFWVRNDACFLILGACLVYLYSGYHCGPVVMRERFVRTLIFGATSVVVASPWLINNTLGFGHIMPVSGRAESLTGTFAGNLDDVPAVLIEYLTLFLPIPQNLQDHPAVVAGSVAILLVTVGILLVVWRQGARPVRALIVMIGIYTTSLILFYGLFFGAPWFIARYLFPVSPYLALLGVAVLWKLCTRLASSMQMPVAALAGLLALGLVCGLNYRLYQKGATHQHFQVVTWVEANTTPETYVGAIQTGTLGFFHDRTINLDGKVNIKAYDALKEARLAEYVAASQIEVLADWSGIVDWYDMPPIRKHFEIVVNDAELNLGVLRRYGASGAAANSLSARKALPAITSPPPPTPAAPASAAQDAGSGP